LENYNQINNPQAMTDQLTDNELIAEFMGLVRRPANAYYNLPQWWQPVKDKRQRGEFVGYPEQLKYNSSWDELMPVVEKINSFDKTGVCIYPKHCIISVDGTAQAGAHDFSSGELPIDGILIKIVHLSVTNYIKWYNNQQKP
jgi:hypothetical protein